MIVKLLLRMPGRAEIKLYFWKMIGHNDHVFRESHLVDSNSNNPKFTLDRCPYTHRHVIQLLPQYNITYLAVVTKTDVYYVAITVIHYVHVHVVIAVIVICSTPRQLNDFYVFFRKTVLYECFDVVVRNMIIVMLFCGMKFTLLDIIHVAIVPIIWFMNEIKLLEWNHLHIRESILT